MRFALLIGVTALSACELQPEFERSNPFDPGSPYEMRMVGVPDTLDARGARFTATIERDPPLPPGPLSITWRATDPRFGVPPGAPPIPSALVLPIGNGEFLISQSLTAEMVTTAIAAEFNSEVVVGRNIVVGQRARTLTLSCGTASAPVACDAAPLNIGATTTVRSAARDAGRSPLSGLQFAMNRARVVSRNPAVIASAVTPNALGTYTFTAVGAGSAWVVITVDFATDSVRFVVNP